jgi:hypothetical protein
MKSLLIGLFAAVSFSAFAGVSDVEPTTDVVPLSRVEQVIEIQKSPRIALIMTDNGGSTDVSSYVAPSTLNLTAFMQGEEYDIDATYVVSREAVKIKKVWFNDKTGVITIRSTRMNDKFETYEVKTTVYIADLLKEINDASAKGEEHTVVSTIGVATNVK